MLSARSTLIPNHNIHMELADKLEKGAVDPTSPPPRLNCDLQLVVGPPRFWDP